MLSIHPRKMIFVHMLLLVNTHQSTNFCQHWCARNFSTLYPNYHNLKNIMFNYCLKLYKTRGIHIDPLIPPTQIFITKTYHCGPSNHILFSIRRSKRWCLLVHIYFYVWICSIKVFVVTRSNVRYWKWNFKRAQIWNSGDTSLLVINNE